jgi:hypothetical protein
LTHLTDVSERAQALLPCWNILRGVRISTVVNGARLCAEKTTNHHKNQWCRRASAAVVGEASGSVTGSGVLKFQ